MIDTKNQDINIGMIYLVLKYCDFKVTKLLLKTF